MRKFALWFIFAWLTLASGCARMPKLEQTFIRPANLGELQEYLRYSRFRLDDFKSRGPFEVTVRENHELRLSPVERFDTDLFLAAPAGKAPLVVILHGLDGTKSEHAYQAFHLASWGLHSLTLQLPNQGPWVDNGRTLAKIVDLIHQRPEIIDSRIDVKNIVLVGHSYGATSVAVALAEGSPAPGAILLDPAAISRDLPGYLGRVRSTVLVLGADEHITSSRNRDYFYRFIPGGVGEVSIKGANHEDAQFPSGSMLASLESQVTFVSALTAAAISLASTGRFDLAWVIFDDAITNGALFNQRRK